VTGIPTLKKLECMGNWGGSIQETQVQKREDRNTGDRPALPTSVGGQNLTRENRQKQSLRQKGNDTRWAWGGVEFEGPELKGRAYQNMDDQRV